MEVALGPGRFYGGGLPRPRVFPGDRVDPPAPIADAFLCWARDTHWSMGRLGANASVCRAASRATSSSSAAPRATTPGSPPNPPSPRDTFRKEYKEKHPNNKQVFVAGKAGGEKWKSLNDANG